MMRSIILSLLVCLLCSGCSSLEDKVSIAEKLQKDDWVYGVEEKQNQVFKPSSSIPIVPLTTIDINEAKNINIGLATGGAKDVGNFRENISHNYLPLPTDITYEGLFYDYYFDTGQTQACDKLFCPSYSYAVSHDPFSKKPEYYLCVGLNSGIKKSDLKRKKLNLVVVLDISSSMDSSFERYYYDRFDNFRKISPREYSEENKMEVAKKSLQTLIDHLQDGDRLGVVLFDDSAYLGKSLSLVKYTDISAIKSHIAEIVARGGTNMEAGMHMASDLYQTVEVDSDQYENRILFLTDAMPNLGDTSESGLLRMLQRNAANKIYTTFLGIGVDFNSELIEKLTKIRGANYYTVHSAKEFQRRLDEEFVYMVTPLVFDLRLQLHAQGYEIEKVYGSPEADEATGELMKINTLFPSARQEGCTKGGLVLIKLKKTSADSKLALTTSYQNRNGKTDQATVHITLPHKDTDFYQNTGIHKGILLVRYANLLKNWLRDERSQSRQGMEISVNRERGIVIPNVALGRWERQSLPLKIADVYRELFHEFSGYWRAQVQALDDDTMQRELEILDKLGR